MDEHNVTEYCYISRNDNIYKPRCDEVYIYHATNKQLGMKILLSILSYLTSLPDQEERGYKKINTTSKEYRDITDTFQTYIHAAVDHVYWE